MLTRALPTAIGVEPLVPGTNWAHASCQYLNHLHARSACGKTHTSGVALGSATVALDGLLNIWSAFNASALSPLHSGQQMLVESDGRYAVVRSHTSPGLRLAGSGLARAKALKNATTS